MIKVEIPYRSNPVIKGKYLPDWSIIAPIINDNERIIAVVYPSKFAYSDDNVSSSKL